MTCTYCHNENEANVVYKEIEDAENQYHYFGLMNSYGISYEERLRRDIVLKKSLERLTAAYKARDKLVEKLAK